MNHTVVRRCFITYQQRPRALKKSWVATVLWDIRATTPQWAALRPHGSWDYSECVFQSIWQVSLLLRPPQAEGPVPAAAQPVSPAFFASREAGSSSPQQPWDTFISPTTYLIPKPQPYHTFFALNSSPLYGSISVYPTDEGNILFEL